MVAPGRMVTSSRRAGRVTNKTKLLIYRGSDKVDPEVAETVLWDQDSSGAGKDSTKHQHIGATGVESNELLEHHLQAALSSASVIHSSDKAPQSAANKATAVLNYHIPTPDATGLINNAQFAQLYQRVKYNEPYNFIRFSDTVEESSCGWGGLGYCMDDADVKWLSDFNSKAEGSSGEVKSEKEQGRGLRAKGKEKEKGDAPPPLSISEDVFEYIMGVFDKYTEDNVPMLHTNLALLPPFSSIENMFASPISPSFLPSNERPREISDLKALTRMARSVYSHWKQRREQRQGKPIVPALNFDETNDNDPYVCFRRRDIRATRKTRRTDNFSIEQFQKLQYELKAAYSLSQMVLQRETEKQAFFKADKEVWETRWKLFETKRRWPSLGCTPQEEELITGRTLGPAPIQIPSISAHGSISSSSGIQPTIRKRMEKERDDRSQRDRYDAQQRGERSNVLSGRSNAPDALKDRLAALHQKIEDLMARKKHEDSQWDDYTDNSYQPLSSPLASRHYSSIYTLDPSRLNQKSDSDDEELVTPEQFSIRRGRGGVVRLDRRTPVVAHRRGAQPNTPSELPSWLFPDIAPSKQERKRPRSIDEVEEETSPKVPRSASTETWRYSVDRGGAVGVGMGITEEHDRILIDDLDSKYIRYRVSLLKEKDIDKLRPNAYILEQTYDALEAAADAKPPPAPIFQKPSAPQHNPQVIAHLQQQQMLHQQQQVEQFQRFQMIAQQQALVQQQALAQAQAQAQAQAHAQAQPQAQGIPHPQPQSGSNHNSPAMHAQQQILGQATSRVNSPAVNGQHQQQMLQQATEGVAKGLKLPAHAVARLGAMANGHPHHMQQQQGQPAQ
ncbi:hypothetical protein I350_06774 [Cryptococcus amylolentus CBS 6273]|uniref:Enhancer of polycomb-like protein n=1 Tax=Cryptococcus amylolentus CBS 6273 TaxID=1296118 RepID=A0A1E3JGY9_9TREE|nr:hypothetical protein I350_06774 [Cryptococcus amylolentus CBS 6273]